MARSRVDMCLGRVKRCFSHALIFAAQVCAIYVVILLSGLLVFWSAIFIDSKRDGTGAAHGRKGFRMKRAELDRRIANGETLDDIVPALMDDGADITSYDDLKRFAIEKIESDELYLAEHVLKACLDVADYYGYDYSMGTLEKPTAIDGVEDLIDYVED